MSPLHLIRDGISTAAELAALLFLVPISPVSATEAAAVSAAPSRVVALRPDLDGRDLHIVNAALEMRLLGMLADMRIVQTVRNDGAQAVDLGARLPAVGDTTDHLKIVRDGRAADLLGAATVACGDDPHAGHAFVGEDESIADLLQLSPGHWASVAIEATEAMQPSGDAYRVALPVTMAPLGTQALWVGESRGSALVVIPPPNVGGSARLTLRYADRPARQVLLGNTAPSSVWVVPLDVDRLPQLIEGAVELEIRDVHTVHWTTLSVRSDSGSKIARRVD